MVRLGTSSAIPCPSMAILQLLRLCPALALSRQSPLTLKMPKSSAMSSNASFTTRTIVAGHSYGGLVVIESIRGFEKRGAQDGGVIHCLVMSAFVGCKGESLMSILDHKLPEFLEVDVSML